MEECDENRADGTYVYLVYQPGTDDYLDACTKGTYTAENGTLAMLTTGLIESASTVWTLTREE